MLKSLALRQIPGRTSLLQQARRWASSDTAATDATTAASTTSTAPKAAESPFKFSGLIPERTIRRSAAETASTATEGNSSRPPMPLPSFTRDGPLNIPTSPYRSAPSRGPFATYSGRTTQVFNGDIVGAFRSLGSTLRQNNVMRDFRQQKFYEKPSDKRGRLSRERHRRRFLMGVRRLVGLVKEQRKFQ